MSLADQVARYYAARAPVYDLTAGYLEPEAESLRAPIKERYRRLFADHDALEVACGTGYWTTVIAENARLVMTTDIHPELVCLAAGRCRHQPHVTLQVADAFALEGVRSGFTAGVAILWWSHVPRGRLCEWLSVFHSKLRGGALVMFVDQLPYDAPGRRQDADGNTLETRLLPDGRSYEIVKNFPTAHEIHDLLADFTTDIRYTERPAEKSWDVVYSTR
ncbi:MAG: class I SAM-dependent methyltransferase [Phycisphaerae bacterium]|nr:class I SAM-dependent methyltransferase [Phycisphaerae bacterium]